MNMEDLGPKSDAQVSQIVILDQNPVDRRRKRLLFRVFKWKDDKIRYTGVANCDFGQKSDAQASQTVTFS